MADDSEFESVITDEMRDQIGVEGAPTVSEVTNTSVRMFARAVGYEDPVYFDVEEATGRGLRGLPAPPGYLGTPVFDPRHSEGTFGGRRGAGPRIQSPYKLVLNGGTDVEYFEESICSGDVLTSTSQLESLNERYSAALGGPMLIQVTKTTYTNQDGATVAVARGTGISYGPKRDES